MSAALNIFSDEEQNYHDVTIPMMNKNIYDIFTGKLKQEFIEAMRKFLVENNYLKDGLVKFSYIEKYSEKFGNEQQYVVFFNASVATETFELDYLIQHPNNFTSEAIIRAIAYRVFN